MRASVTAAVFFSLLPLSAFAATLEERVEALEKTHGAELYHTQEEKKTESGIKLGDRITLSGLLEINAYLNREKTKGEGTDNTSDLFVETAQLGIKGKINEYFTANFILLHDQETVDEGGPELEFDEATIDYERGAWSARFGRLYVPFGEYVSHFIDDPIIVDLGQTRETAALASYNLGDFLAASVFAYSGDADKAGDSQDLKRRLNDWGLSVKVLPAKNFEAGASFLSDLADSDADWPTTATHYEERVPGWSAFGRLSWEPLALSAEVVGAAKRFDRQDLDVDGKGQGDRPFAWNVEAAWQIVSEVELAGRVEGSQEFFDHPKLQFGVDASWGVYEGITLSASYLHGTFDEYFSSGLKTRDRFVAQLAAEF